jgi:hypothetical protein
LDGLCFDAAGRNQYGGQPGDGIGRISPVEGPLATFSAPNVTIRNCVFANSVNGGVELSGSGSRFENNLLINLIGIAMLSLRSSSQLIGQPIAVTGNTFCFMHDLGEPAGTGGDRAQGVRIQCPAVIAGNVFVACGNAAIATLLDPMRIAIERNVFFATPHSLIEVRTGGTTGAISEGNLEELEDLGFKACAGNLVKDPAISGLAVAWLDASSRDLLARYAKPPRDALNALRAAAGLPALAKAEVDKPEQKGALAPRYGMGDIARLSLGATEGFHAVSLPAQLTPRLPAPTPDYRRIDWAALTAADAGLANAPVELRVGFGTEQNIDLLADAPSATHRGVRVYKPGSDEDTSMVLMRRGGFASRLYDEARTYQRGMEVESTYWLRGIYRTGLTSTRQQATLIVEGIAGAPMQAAPLPGRPYGRDWFVRAGSSGGDGSREKPLRDPFQALEKAAGGDAIHVAGGDYFGKLRAGKWLIAIRYLTLLGGYNADFTMRDPWTNGTRFLLDGERKPAGRPEGTMLSSEEASDGLVVDGFIFDGATWNTYTDGSLALDASPSAPLVRLRGLSSPITVRNCLFVNASDGALSIDCPLCVIENNIMVNTSGDALVVHANGAGPALIRNNTMLFAADPTPRAGTGKSSAGGTMIQLAGRAAIVLEANIIGFADNFGLRAALPQDNVSLRRNVFAANLFNQLTDCQYLFADSATWQRRVEGDSSYTLEGNQLLVPQLPVDAAFSDLALPRLFALPSRITREEWPAIAVAIGSSARPQPVGQPASASAAMASPAPAPASPGGSSLAALMAKIASTTEKLKAIETTKEPAKPTYCPRYDCAKALALALPTDDAGTAPGAHRTALEVSFGTTKAAPQVTYMPLAAADVDRLRAELNQHAVELSVTQLRDSSTNPSVFAPGTDKRDYSAYGVVAVDAPTRTRLALVVRDDTQVSTLIRRAQPSDTLRIRGMAYTTSGESGLSILVDAVEVVGG